MQYERSPIESLPPIVAAYEVPKMIFEELSATDECQEAFPDPHKISVLRVCRPETASGLYLIQIAETIEVFVNL